MNSVSDTRLGSSPHHLYLATTVAIFLGEVAVMLLLAALPRMPVVLEAFVDGILLTLVATPVLYLYLFRPMARAKKALGEANSSLERRVAERTAELLSANKSLAKNNEFITSVVESAPCLLMFYDLRARRCNYANGHLEAILGYTPEEVSVGENLLRRIFDPHDYHALLEIGDGEGGDYPDQIHGHEVLLVCRDGSPLLSNVIVNVMSRDVDGNPHEILLAAIPVAGGTAAPNPF